MDRVEAAVVEPHAGPADHVPHVLPLKVYFGVFGALLALTALTVGVSYFDFGDWNIAVALAVATAKAALVAAVFMHLAFDEKFNLVVFLVGVLFLAIFLGFTLADTENRGVADELESQRARDFTAPFADGKPDVVGPRAIVAAPAQESATGAGPAAGAEGAEPAAGAEGANPAAGAEEAKESGPAPASPEGGGNP